MPKPPERRKPGLPAVHEGREQRMAGKYSRPTGTLWLLMGAGLLASLLVYRLVSGRELEQRRSSLLGKQRAIEKTLGAEWSPLRDRLEKFVFAKAAPFEGDHVEPAAKQWDAQVQPGLYLRIRIEDTKNADTLRRASQDSLRDGFTSCLLKTENAALAHGEADAAALPDQPWNLRQAYASTRILTPEWVSEVETAGDVLRLRVFEQQYDKAERDDIPRAIDIVKKAEFFLVVLDEPADEPAPVARASDAGIDTAEEALQLAPHWARIYLLDLKHDAEILRVRRHAEGKFYFTNGRAPGDEETADALKRQVNNCALAQQVRASLP